MNELTKFLNLMALRSKNLESQGGFKAIFETDPMPHIKLTSGKYQLLEEGQIVTEEVKEDVQVVAVAEGSPGPMEDIAKVGTDTPGDAPAGGLKTEEAPAPKTIASIVDILKKIRSQNEAGPGGAEIPMDCAKIVDELEEKPEEVARLTLENLKDAPEIESVIKRVVSFLVEGLISFLLETGKDITKALEKLAKELEKSLSKVTDDEKFKDLKGKIPAIFEEAADDLRIQMMVRTYKKNPADTKSHEKMAGKLFKDEKVRRRLQNRLQDEMEKAGMPPEQCQLMLSKIEEKAANKKSKVSIDAEKLAELKRMAENFDEELEKRLKATVQKMEREKQVILDEKERVDSVIRNLAEGLLVVDKNGKVVLMNPAAKKLLGIKKDEKKGKSILDGLKDEHVVAMASGNLRGTGGDVSKKVEVVSFNDETRRVLQASTAVIENEDGQTVGMVSVLSDVTKQRQLDELKNTFVANVSHELRTPLVAIQKSLSTILKKELGEVSPDQEKFLGIAHRNIDRLSRLINDLLDLSKLEAKGMTLNLKNFPAKEMIQNVVATVETWAKDKKIQFEIESAEESLQLYADADRLTQVLTNLIGNAIKFTSDNGKIIIKIRKIEDASAPEGLVEIGVQDTGIGIAPEDLEKIFEKFVQVSLTQPQGISSTGLGLTIAKEIVELHEGKIWVESEVGKGSCFLFRIPVRTKEKV